MLMGEKLKEQIGPVTAVGAWLAVILSIITLSAVVWKGGALAQKVETDHIDLQALKAQGSPSLVTHEQMDDQRLKAVDQRLEKLERACETFTRMSMDVAECKTALEFLTGKRGSTVAKP